MISYISVFHFPMLSLALRLCEQKSTSSQSFTNLDALFYTKQKFFCRCQSAHSTFPISSHCRWSTTASRSFPPRLSSRCQSCSTCTLAATSFHNGCLCAENALSTQHLLRDSDMFRYVGNLRILGIGETPIRVIPADAFRNIPSLRRLEMSEAAVDTIEPGAFQVASQIGAIIMNRNRLSRYSLKIIFHKLTQYIVGLRATCFRTSTNCTLST